MVESATAINLAPGLITRMDCNGDFEAAVVVTIVWGGVPPGRRPVEDMTFAATPINNVQGLETRDTITGDAWSVKQGTVEIFGSLTDPAQNGSFKFTASNKSGVVINNNNLTVAVPKFGYSVAGVGNATCPGAVPNDPFTPLPITIKNLEAVAVNFKITLTDQRNCGGLQVNGTPLCAVVLVAPTRRVGRSPLAVFW